MVHIATSNGTLLIIYITIYSLHTVPRRLLKATIILVPVLGFTWIIGLFAVGEEGKVFAYLFVIANVFQVSNPCYGNIVVM